jgi:phosphate:Na+ symporter
VRRHWQHELAKRLREHRLDPWLASSLMNDLHQAGRLIATLTETSCATQRADIHTHIT